MPVFTVSRELSTMPAAAAAAATPTAGFHVGEMLELGPRIDSDDLGDRHPLVGAAAGSVPTVVTLLRSSSVSDARQNLIVRLHSEISRKLASAPRWAAGGDLRGIPFWIGLLRDDDGRPRVAAGEVNLLDSGFYSLDDVLTRYWEDFWHLPVPRRLAFVHALLRTLAALDELKFVHGAIDASSILLHPLEGAVALTKVGSGTLAAHGRSQVSSVGVHSDFLAPELIDPAGHRPELAGVATDRWSIGVAIFYLLFGFHPLYFLPDLGRRTVESYLQKNTWPAVPPAVAAAGSVPVDLVQAVDAISAQLPGQVTFLLSQLFEGGWAVPARRPDVGAWVAAFGVPLSPPVFVRVSVRSSVVIEGGEAAVSWETVNADEVEIVGVGRFPPTGSTRVPIHAPRHLELRAYGQLGSATETTRRIDVVPTYDIGVPSAFPTSAVPPPGPGEDDEEFTADSEPFGRSSGPLLLLSETMFSLSPGEATLLPSAVLGEPPRWPGSAHPAPSAPGSTPEPNTTKHPRAPWRRSPWRRQTKKAQP